jgi:hypothetical protein
MRFIAFVTFILASIIGSNGQPAPSKTFSTVHVFHDRSDARLEWVFIIRGKEVVAQRHVFPGYSDRTVFHLEVAPSDTLEAVKKYCSLPGDTKPPFVPEGPWYARDDVRLDRDEQRITEFFANTNKGLSWMLRKLRTEVLKVGPASKLPAWIQDSSELMDQLGRFKNSASNHSAAANSAIALVLQVGDQRRGVAGRDRSP